MQIEAPLKSKFIGALTGTAVGDALGAPVEGYSTEAVEFLYGQRREKWNMSSGRYTDDTEMMIGIAESLIKNDGLMEAHAANYWRGREKTILLSRLHKA